MENKEKIIVGYCRSACAKDSDQTRVDEQKKLVEQFAKKQKLEIKDFYIDNGVGGLTLDRPEFKRLLEDCRNGKVEAIVMRDIDRIARNVMLVGTALDIFKENNIKLYFVWPTDLKFHLIVRDAHLEVLSKLP
jgi:DNA invertase Pin-like site-specific DNA recombinase